MKPACSVSIPPEGFVPIAFVRLLFGYLKDRQVDAASVLETAQPARTQNPLDAFPARQFCAMLEKASRHLNDPLLGLHLGQTLRPAHLGALGYVLASCATVSEALMRFARYQSLLHDTNDLRIYPQAELIVLEWPSEGGAFGRFFDEMGLAAIVQFTRSLASSQDAVTLVDFTYAPPPSTQPYESFFGGEVRFQQPATRIHMPLSYLARKLTKPDPELAGLLESQVEALLQQSPREDDLGRSVRRSVARLAHHGVPTLQQVAAAMRLSPRQLTGQLRKRELNFRALRDSTLRQVAEQHMANRALTLTEVALLLGYSELSAFTRAYTRWTGQSPREWRSR